MSLADKFLKLTDALSSEVEFVNSEEITNIMPVLNQDPSKPSPYKSRVFTKNGTQTYVKETPEEIINMMKGSNAWEHHR